MTTYKTNEREIYNQALRNVTKANKNIARLYLESFERIEQKIAVQASKIFAGKVKNFDEIARLEQLQESIRQELRSLNVKVNRTISTNWINNYENTYYSTGYNIETEVNLGKGFQNMANGYNLNYSILPSEAISVSLNEQIAGHTFKDRLKRDRDILQFRVREEVAKTLIEGLGPRELAKNLRGIDDIFAINENRAIATSRTELLRAYSLGQDDSVNYAKDAGVEFTFSWSATLDLRTRNDHQILDKNEPDRIVDGEPIFVFSSGGETTGPRLSGIAKQDINCRCRRLNQPFGIEPTARVTKLKKGSWEKMESNQSYSEWLKALPF